MRLLVGRVMNNRPQRREDSDRVRGELQAGNVRLLLVEDNELLRGILREQLEEAGYSVTVAADGTEGLQAVQKGDFALVISNVRMPGLDGVELLRRMRAEVETDHVPFLAATTDPSSSVRRQIDQICTEHGGTAELVGKDSIEALLDTVERLLHSEGPSPRVE